MEGQQMQIQETSPLSSLISKVLETIGNHPVGQFLTHRNINERRNVFFQVEVAFLVLAFIVVRWFQGRSSKS